LTDERFGLDFMVDGRGIDQNRWVGPGHKGWVVMKTFFMVVALLFSVAAFADEAQTTTEHIVPETIVAGDLNGDGIKDYACVVRSGPEDPQHLVIFFKTRKGTLYLAFDEPMIHCQDCGEDKGVNIGLTAAGGFLAVTQDDGNRFLNLENHKVVYKHRTFIVSWNSATYDMNPGAGNNQDKPQDLDHDQMVYDVIGLKDPIQSSVRVRSLIQELKTLLVKRKPSVQATLNVLPLTTPLETPGLPD
jgi:hypothetical protein